jgi:hypothetical protein
MVAYLELTKQLLTLLSLDDKRGAEVVVLKGAFVHPCKLAGFQSCSVDT